MILTITTSEGASREKDRARTVNARNGRFFPEMGSHMGHFQLIGLSAQPQAFRLGSPSVYTTSSGAETTRLVRFKDEAVFHVLFLGPPARGSAAPTQPPHPYLQGMGDYFVEDISACPTVNPARRPFFEVMPRARSFGKPLKYGCTRLDAFRRPYPHHRERESNGRHAFTISFARVYGQGGSSR